MNAALILFFSIVLMPNLLESGKRFLLLISTIMLVGFLYYYHVFLVYDKHALIAGIDRVVIDCTMAGIGGYLYYFLQKK